jgi:hypothetical protein
MGNNQKAIHSAHKTLIHLLPRETEKSQTIRWRGCSRSEGGAGVGVVRRRHWIGDEGVDVLGGVAEVGVALPASVELPVTGSAPFLIGLGLGCRWGDWRRGKLRTSSPGPHLPFIALCDGGPPTISGWAPPIRAQEQGPKAVGPNGKEIKPNILPP